MIRNISHSQPLITLGSPVGIGYEIFLRSLGVNGLFDDGQCPVCIGSQSVMEWFIKLCALSVCYRVVDPSGPFPDETDTDFILINIDPVSFEVQDIFSIDTKIDGECALLSIKYGALLVQEGHFGSLVTLPVSKKRINLVESTFTGHTEYIQKIWEADHVFMTFVAKTMTVMLLTTHLPIKEVSRAIDSRLLQTALEEAWRLKEVLSLDEKVVVLGLNPHAGEDGLLGDEEIWMKQIIRDFNSNNQADISGPVPADTAFTDFSRAGYGLYIAAYHDQGLIPFKTFHFNDGVNLSWGMPFIRTSVDHGTAVDLIGTGRADLTSFINAYKLAVKLNKDHF